MAYKLVCVHPFHGFVRGQEVTDPADVAKHLAEKERHFVKVAVPDTPVVSIVKPAEPQAGYDSAI